MIDLLIAAQAAPSITIELPTAVSAAAWVITILLGVLAGLFGVIVWFLRREIRNNDAAHQELRTDIKKLLEGDVAWIKAVMARLPR